MLAIVYSRALFGMDSPLVTVEVHLSAGLPGFSIVGLPEAAVKESKDRVRSAIINSGFEFPNRRITVNLAPADLPKEGSRFDLPIALGVLAASGVVSADLLRDAEFIGELALGGGLRSVRGLLPSACQTKTTGRCLFVPKEEVMEAALISGVSVYGGQSLTDIVAHLKGTQLLPVAESLDVKDDSQNHLDMADVWGQHHVKRALEIAAAGGHNVLMVGPPGTGKTMMAMRLPGILPAMSDEEALECATLQSVSGLGVRQWKTRPFRAPHHTSSAVSLVGGGAHPKPGEISLSHNGVLFLDEFPEFERRVIESLREPMESGHITVSRAAMRAEFPARFQLLAAMNPCPCGYLGESSGRCRCTEEQVQRYRARLSGPILDRIDLHVEVPRLPDDWFTQKNNQQQKDRQLQTVAIRERVTQARQRQWQRSGCANAHLSSQQLDKCCELSQNDSELLEQAGQKFGFSARSYHRILKLARTLADLAGANSIGTEHLTEALSYRALDRPQQGAL